MSAHPGLSRAGLRVRAGATALALGLVLAGSLWGEDDHFPFGPFKMYARSTKTTGAVVVPELVAVTDRGEEIVLGAGDVGLRRAELEGQMPRLQRQPGLLDRLAAAYERGHPAGPRLVEVRILSKAKVVEDGRFTGQRRRGVLVVWRRPPSEADPVRRTQ